MVPGWHGGKTHSPGFRDSSSNHSSALTALCPGARPSTYSVLCKSQVTIPASQVP